MTRRGRLSIKCNTFFPENFKRRFPVETFPRTVIQKRLNRGNVGFRNRPEIEALRVKEANHIVREALNKLARAGSVRFFVRQKNGKQWNTVCISCFSFCVDGEKDKLSSRRRFIQSFPNRSRRWERFCRLPEPWPASQSGRCPDGKLPAG